MKYAFLSLALLASPAYAQVPTYDIDASHTRIFFRVDHAGFSDLVGEFTSYDGYFTFDAEKPESSTAEIAIKVDSIETSSKELDGKLVSSQFFNAGKFPEITFKSTKVTKTGEHKGTLEGELTMHGVTKPMLFNVSFNKGADFMGSYKTGFAATGTLKRSDFGIDKYVPTVSDEVRIEIQTEGVRRDVEPPKKK